jgi:hypothetical protein
MVTTERLAPAGVVQEVRAGEQVVAHQAVLETMEIR